MSAKNKTVKIILFVITWILTWIEMYILSTVLTCMGMGAAVLTTSIFSTVPPILSDNFWVLFLWISIPVSFVLLFIVILKTCSMHKEAKERNKALHAVADPYTSQAPEKE